MNRYLRLFLCLPLLATGACAADAIAGPELAPEPESAVQAAPEPAAAEEGAASAARPGIIFCRRTISPPRDEPLYIVDGVVEAGPLPAVDPADIQSIQVLKGEAAAALYGTRAVRGAIIITTLSGAARARASRRM